MLRNVCLTYLESPDASPERESVSSIQLTLTFKDGKSETSDIYNDGGSAKSDGGEQDDKADSSSSDGSSTGEKRNAVVFEVKEVKDFPQASGFLDIQEIFVVTKNTDRETREAGAEIHQQQELETAPPKRPFVPSVTEEVQTEPLCLAKKRKPINSIFDLI